MPPEKSETRWNPSPSTSGSSRLRRSGRREGGRRLVGCGWQPSAGAVAIHNFRIVFGFENPLRLLFHLLEWRQTHPYLLLRQGGFLLEARPHLLSHQCIRDRLVIFADRQVVKRELQ